MILKKINSQAKTILIWIFVIKLCKFRIFLSNDCLKGNEAILKNCRPEQYFMIKRYNTKIVYNCLEKQNM
jgi:hypothetical protein